MFKYRILALQSLFCCVVSLANMRYAEIDVKQIISAIFIALMSLFMAYVGPHAKQFY